ncbi:hypothetical protein ACFQ4L_04940 [Lapidilactobacillus mulanensis]|uniref:HTH cro/C1-type domain-containing protein n=1 Tax=Lapidilactobacillus mulanensis TaxID=2485999 RepID=A0ABW4DLB3_9LACO
MLIEVQVKVVKSLGNTYGKAYRLLRSSKGFTQEEATGSSITKQALSLFENDRSMISLDHFVDILGNINASFEEFITLVQGEDNREWILAEIHHAQRKQDLLQIKRIYERACELADENEDQYFYQHLRILTKIFAVQIDPYAEAVTDEEVETIHDYLIRVELWGNYEYDLFRDTIDLFSASQILLLSNEAFDARHVEDRVSHLTGNCAEELLFAIIDRLLTLGEVDKCREFLDKAAIYLNQDDINILMKMKYFKGIIDYLQGDPKGKEAAKSVINMIYDFGNREMANKLFQQYQQFIVE